MKDAAAIPAEVMILAMLSQRIGDIWPDARESRQYSSAAERPAEAAFGQLHKVVLSVDFLQNALFAWVFQDVRQQIGLSHEPKDAHVTVIITCIGTVKN